MDCEDCKYILIRFKRIEGIIFEYLGDEGFTEKEYLMEFISNNKDVLTPDSDTYFMLVEKVGSHGDTFNDLIEYFRSEGTIKLLDDYHYSHYRYVDYYFKSCSRSIDRSRDSWVKFQYRFLNDKRLRYE